MRHSSCWSSCSCVLHGFRAVALPLLVAGIVGAFYLRGFPTGGGSLTLVLALAVTGAVLGTASGLTSRVWDANRHVLVQASASAAALWLVGMVGRACFQFWADGPGSRQTRPPRREPGGKRLASPSS
jgi:hypothetical protein